MKPSLSFLLLLFTFISNAQTVVTTVPQFPSQTDKITITFNTTNANPAGKAALINYFGTAYAHTGVTLSIDNGAPQKWQDVIGNWGDNAAQPALTLLGTNLFQIVINNPMLYYKVALPPGGHTIKITELSFVIRSSDASKQTEDIFVPLYSPGISLKLISPLVSTFYGDPLRSPLFVSPDACCTNNSKSFTYRY